MGRDQDPLGTKPDEQILQGKTASKYTDPCKKAAALSMKCLEDNMYDRTKCAYAFNNYRECKKQWIASRKQGGLPPQENA
ncbi:uncharacterized protein FA14DRAFT_35813 [Meira miltonrushii]|uniref:CHCH domain-containing protein n=1 Tax=Meira miltonrushii TaxID=1280837 RepID=A0A316VBB3_9BASI|nr:uncharacterized protein FA14DRAFT_35813 [Meira miltonrushii]PWN34929.1 hypothetical protein FA14DRAFT_35813 [Meira miltonrushii]